MTDRQLGALHSNPVWQECRTRSSHHRPPAGDNLAWAVSTLGDLLRGVSAGSIWVRGLQRGAATRLTGTTPPVHYRSISVRLHIISLAPCPRHHSAFDPGSIHRKLRHITVEGLSLRVSLELLDTSAIYHPLMEFKMGLICCERKLM